MKLPRLLRPYFDIYFRDSLYMRRWWIVGDDAARDAGKITAGVHHIVRRDRAPDMHTHPCTFISIVLWRWYRERRPYRQSQSAILDDIEFVERVRWPGSIALRRATDRHNIVEVAPGGTWTLIIWLRKTPSSCKGGSWGFWRIRDGEYVPWREYEGDRS